MNAKLINQWEKLKENPSETYKSFFIAEKKFLEDNIPESSIVLDIGCGSGEHLVFLSKTVKEVYGIDNDENAISRAKVNTTNLKNVKILLEDAEKMNFKNNYFDRVICMGTTFGNFGSTQSKVLLEIRRILKNKGLFLFSIYNENALDERLWMYKKYCKSVEVKDNGIVFIDKVISKQFFEEEIRKILGNNGFEIVEIVKRDIFYLIKAGVKK